MRLDEVVDWMQSERLELLTVDKELMDDIGVWFNDYTEDFCSALGLERMSFNSMSLSAIYELLKSNRSKLRKLKRKVENCLSFNEAIIHVCLQYKDYPYDKPQTKELKLFFALLLWVGIVPDSIFKLLSNYTYDKEAYAKIIADFGVITPERAEYLLPVISALSPKQRKHILKQCENSEDWELIALGALCYHFNKK